MEANNRYESRVLLCFKNSSLVIMLITAVLCGCTANIEPKADINGKWDLISYGNETSPTFVVPNIPAWINFEKEHSKISGNVGCNMFMGNYIFYGDSITVSSIASTMMYCNLTSAQETAVLGLLQGSTFLTTRFNGDYLMITNGTMMINLSKRI